MTERMLSDELKERCEIEEFDLSYCADLIDIKKTPENCSLALDKADEVFKNRFETIKIGETEGAFIIPTRYYNTPLHKIQRECLSFPLIECLEYDDMLEIRKKIERFIPREIEIEEREGIEAARLCSITFQGGDSQVGALINTNEDFRLAYDSMNIHWSKGDLHEHLSDKAKTIVERYNKTFEMDDYERWYDDDYKALNRLIIDINTRLRAGDLDALKKYTNYEEMMVTFLRLAFKDSSKFQATLERFPVKAHNLKYGKIDEWVEKIGTIEKGNKVVTWNCIHPLYVHDNICRTTTELNTDYNLPMPARMRSELLLDMILMLWVYDFNPTITNALLDGLHGFPMSYRQYMKKFPTKFTEEEARILRQYIKGKYLIMDPDELEIMDRTLQVRYKRPFVELEPFVDVLWSEMPGPEGMVNVYDRELDLKVNLHVRNGRADYLDTKPSFVRALKL